MALRDQPIWWVERGRRFLGIELKESYYKQACANLRNAESAMEQTGLFAEVGG